MRRARRSGKRSENEAMVRGFRPEMLDRSIIAIPLLEALAADRSGEANPQLHDVIIDINLDFHGGREAAKRWVRRELTLLVEAKRRGRGRRPRSRAGAETPGRGVLKTKTQVSRQYVFARVARTDILDLLERDGREARALEEAASGNDRTAGAPRKDFFRIHKVWVDFAVEQQLTESVRTVKSDAAERAYGANGRNIVWAVVDSGIDRNHVHFRHHRNLELDAPLAHVDFTMDDLMDRAADFEDDAPPDESALETGKALEDGAGHGTHVAGIIAGEYRPEWYGAAAGRGPQVAAREVQKVRTGSKQVEERFRSARAIRGIAPECRLVSLRVLDDRGKGNASSLIAALEHVQAINQHGRRILIQGVNLSVGYGFDPEWFACGQSPLCVEVNRLVRSGVVVVTAAGNTGYGWVETREREVRSAGLDLTINDPGNAEMAITVGSTHRESPHRYGVSYFSSKGPTGDGRAKPDLIAPGEKIVSCAAGKRIPEGEDAPAGAETHYYVEQSGTSMAAPHVSGAIAAFLSIRREFIAEPEKVKQIMMESATDLHREPSFQGRGVVDLMRAIQSV